MRRLYNQAPFLTIHNMAMHFPANPTKNEAAHNAQTSVSRAANSIGIALLLALIGCGGSSDDEEPAASTAIVYDEATSGPLPFALQNLSPTDLARYTVQLSNGTNIVKGSSDTGEAILLRIPAASHLQSVRIDFSNHSVGNALVLSVERTPYDGTSFIDIHDMSSVGQFTYTVSPPNSSYGNGDYALRISTAVSGASTPNEFSLGIQVSK
jgi:hypothetical protein